MTWTLSAPGVAQALGDGRFRALRDGNATVHVQVAGRPDLNATASIVVAQRVARLQVLPGDVTLWALHETVELAAVARDARDHPVEGRAPVWVSHDPSVALVAAGGRVTAMSDGSARVSAEIDGLTAWVTITVDATMTTVACVERLDQSDPDPTNNCAVTRVTVTAL